MKNKIAAIQFAGSLLVLLGAVLKFFNFDFASYIFSIGATILIVLQLFFLSKARNENSQVQRLHRLMLFASLMLGAAAYFMFSGSKTWILLTLSYALVSLFLSYRYNTVK
ncbi:MAG: hypothetical protein ACK5L7_08820 [Paludibacteraceae bacterium]